MKKVALSLCCLAGSLFLTSDLPAPGFPSCIDVVKQCADAVNSSELIPFSGTVTNCGYTPLDNVTVVDNNGTPGDPSDDFTVFETTSLAPGATASFSGTYLPRTSPSTNTVTATGFDPSYVDPITDDASVTCKWLDQGCTLTIGYWKTHSKYGPAPYDSSWSLLTPSGEDTTFFLSEKTYYQVLWTEPKGNPYYTLAHQFIATQFNVLNGASIPAEVLDAWTAAESLFETYTPGYVGSLKNNNSLKHRFIALAMTLDYYNMGATGPGHCNGIER